MRPRGYKPVAVRRRRNLSKPVFSERRYGRAAIKRLTPLSWFLSIVVIALIIGAGITIFLRVNENNYQSMLLSERLGQTFAPTSLATRTDVVNTPTAEVTAAAVVSTAVPETVMSVTPTATVTKKDSQRLQTEAPGVSAPTSTPTLTAAITSTPVKAGGSPLRISLPTAVYAQAKPVSGPTPEGGAPWAARLVRQPDGSLLAPPDILAQAAMNLSEYYTETHDMAMADYLSQRDKILAKYFTGDALKEMQGQEITRTQYEKTVAGSVTLIVRNFTLDGYTAKAGIYLRNRVTDNYDVSANILLRQGVTHIDTLVVMTVKYDQKGRRWMYSATANIGDLKPKP